MKGRNETHLSQLISLRLQFRIFLSLKLGALSKHSSKNMDKDSPLPDELPSYTDAMQCLTAFSEFEITRYEIPVMTKS